ncbi:MAG: spondin domain-containing protein [Pseudomonadota bacterium]
MRKSVQSAVLAAAAAVATIPVVATADNKSRSIPSVVVTVENAAPARGAFQTPFWVGIHDGSFDIYDRNVPLGADGLVPAPAVERLAEDGNTGPISDEFSISQPSSPQATIIAQSGPFAPGDTSSVTLQVDPDYDRYFSYASMVIPSNDAFIANGSPLAHQLFDDRGRFVGSRFSVAGTEVLDAGTEFNDELAENTAFLNQGGPDIGVTEDGVVVLHEGLRTDLAFPNGVLSHPVFGFADFLAPTYRAADFSFRYVDLGRNNFFRSRLNARQEVSANLVESRGRGEAFAVSRRGEQLSIRIIFNRLSGPVTMAHLHNAAEGSNGPVVVNLGDGIRSNSVRATISAHDVVGPLAEGDDPFLNLLNELAAGNIYINLHTAENPAGEIRGQLTLR